MRFIGLVGLFTLLLIGYIFSTDRKAVKPRIIMWGLGLQFIFALIILSESFLSWVGMFIFGVLIMFYLFADRVFAKERWREAIGPAAVLVFSGAAVTALSWVLESIKVATILFYITLVFWIVLIAFRKKYFIRYIFSSLMFLALGVLINRGIYGRVIFSKLADKVDQFLKLTDLGSVFLFGNLAKQEYFNPTAGDWPGFGFQFAFTVLPVIIFFSACMAILYHFGIVQRIINAMAHFMRWTMGTSGAETLSCSSNIFVGQTEAPLLIKPFLRDMTMSELHAIMTGGFATIAGSVLGGYIRMGIDAGHLIAASVLSAPAALVMAKVWFPETEHSVTAGDAKIPDVGRSDNVLDAAASGVTDGLKLALNVGAMLLAFIALIGLVDVIFAWFDKLVDHRLLGGTLNEKSGEYNGFFPGSLKTLFGTIFSPLAFLMGVPWKDAMDVGNLLGLKIAVNEFVGYAELGSYVSGQTLSPKSITIATYALCGFANFSSIGIQIGGISALAPERRSDLSKIALRAMFAGAFASWMTATIAGMLL